MDYLFSKFKKIAAKLSGKFIFLFLDYDGTLAPIVNKPEKAVISKETKELLKKLLDNPRFKLSVISGRSLKDIKDRVGINGIIYVGNHGLELEGPKIRFRSPFPSKYRTTLDRIKDDLSRKAGVVKGVFLEDKGLSLALHYRLVDKKQVPMLKTLFHEAVIYYLVKNEIKIKEGKKVLEVRPPVDWDKGKIISWLLARQKFAVSNSLVMPVYIGDDMTDEDAFIALKNKGITIFVGKPGKTQARYYVKDTNQVSEFLKSLLEIKR